MSAKRQLIQKLRELMPYTEKHPFTPIMKAYYDCCRKLETDTEEEIFEGILDLLFAGHETIASTTTNCVMLLGQNKHAVQKVRDELEEHGLLSRDNENLNDITFQSINELKYVNHVVKEVLRLCPPAGAGFRKALKSFELGVSLI